MTIRVGLIGLNYGERVHLPAYKRNLKYEVQAVCALDPDRAEAFAAQHGIARWYTDPRQLIASDLDLISIATPPGTHALLAALAFNAGKHALIEVGVLPSAADTRALIGLAKEKKRLGVPAYVMRYSPILRHIPELLSQNVTGQPRLLRFEFLNHLEGTSEDTDWMWDEKNGGGILNNYIAHALDIARWWFGPILEVDSTLHALGHPEGADDTGVIIAHFESGVLATFTYCAVAAYPHTGFELHGSLASLLIEGFGDEMVMVRRGRTSAEGVFPPMTYLEETRGQKGLIGAFSVFLDRLATTLTAGKLPPDLPTLVDALEIARVMDAIKLAAREKRRVKISEIK